MERTIQARVREDVWEKIVVAASEDRRTVSGWLRKLVEDHFQMVIQVPEEMIRVASEIAEVGLEYGGPTVIEDKPEVKSLIDKELLKKGAADLPVAKDGFKSYSKAKQTKWRHIKKKITF